MPTTTTTVSGQQSIPTELMPYFNQAESKPGAGDQGILQRARQLTTQNYDTTYGNALTAAGLNGSNRIASISPMQAKVGEDLNNLKLDTGYGQAKDIYSGMTNAKQLGQYMNPYIEQALDPQIRLATQNARINSVNQDRGSARAGSYGGARNILAQQQSNQTLQNSLSDIVGKGYNTAYDNAMKTQLAQAQGLTDTATKSTGANLSNMAARASYGDMQRAIQQQQLDTQYSDLMRKQDFPMEQVGNMANILRGVPIVQTGGQTVTNTPAPSFASQLMGAGTFLAGLGQYSRAS
jgi:hypothetical protein